MQPATKVDLAALYSKISTDPDLAFVSDTVQFIASVIKQYNYQGLILSFNGGKDCTVLLHLLCIAIAHLYPQLTSNPLKGIHVIYFPNPHEFPEIQHFMEQTCALYSFSLCIMSGDFKQGLKELLGRDEFQDVRRAIFMGQRRGDPESRVLERLCPSDPGWPKFTRVLPIIDWSYGQVWECLLKLDLPYCSLYSQGYTSLGTVKDTLPNPALRLRVVTNGAEEWTHAHASALTDPSLERSGRIAKRRAECNNEGGSTDCPTKRAQRMECKQDRNSKAKDYRCLWMNVLQEIGDVTVTSCGPSHVHTMYTVTSCSSFSSLLVGFSLGCNTSVSETLCRDKKLTHSVLSASAINVVEHVLISGVKQVHYACYSTRWSTAAAFFEAHNRDVVLKDTKGKSGNKVYRARTLEELESVFCKLQATRPSLVITPFVPSTLEVRVLVLPRLKPNCDGTSITHFESFTPIVFRKIPLRVVGDGVSPLGLLAVQAAPATSCKEAILAQLGEAGGQVLQVGEVWTSWMFNQKLGATFDRVDSIEEQPACELAVRTAKALGLWCCAVDVLMPRTIVLEVNTKIITDILDVPCSESVQLCRDALRLGNALRSAASRASQSIAQEFHLPVAAPNATNNTATTTTTTTTTTATSVDSGNGPTAILYHQRANIRKRLVQQAASARGLEVKSFDEDYLLCSKRPHSNDTAFWNVNYDFGHLLTTESDISKSKALTASLLLRAGLPCVPHKVIYDPSMLDSQSGIAAALQVLEGHFPCVLKPDGGSGGSGVTVVDSLVTAEAMLLTSQQAVTLSPYLKIEAEYRCICVGGKVVLSLSKQRPSVKADGEACVAELIARWSKSGSRALFPRLLEEWSKLALGSTLWTVPPKDQEVLTTWKHNLDYGSTPVLCEPPSNVIAIAQGSASVLGLSFAAVDVVETSQEWKIPENFPGTSHQKYSTTWVLEVNSCPMWTQTSHHLPQVALGCVQAAMDLVLQAPMHA